MAVAVLVGEPGDDPSAGVDVSAYVQYDTLSIEDTGNQTDDTAAFEIMDKALAVTALFPEGPVLITHDGEERFIGFINHIEPAWEGVGRRFRVSCVGLSMLLDKCIIPATSTNAYRRAAEESDRDRIIALLEDFGQPFLAAGSSSYAKIQTLETDMEKQDFQGLTLRQAIERVLGAASENSNYYIDTIGRLNTWDNANPLSDTAPFRVNATPTLAIDEIAPSDLRVDWDTSELVNDYFVKAKTSALGNEVSDAASIAAYGRRQAFIDGPDADTVNKVTRLGRAALRDTKDPIVRANFTVEDDYCENGVGLTWKPGQLVSITSAAHGLDDYEIRIVRTTTTYLNSVGSRRIEIELGALRAHFLGPDQWGTGPGKYPQPTVWIGPPPVPVVAQPIVSGGPLTVIDSEGWGVVDTAPEIELPVGYDTIGRLILMCVQWWADGLHPDVQDDFDSLGWSHPDTGPVVVGEYESQWFWRVIDGTEDFFATGTLVIPVGVEVYLAAVSEIVDGDFSGGVGYVVESVDGSLDPPLISTSWGAGSDVRYYTAITQQLGQTTITSSPAGFDLVGLAYMEVEGGPVVNVQVDALMSTEQVMDPGTYDASGAVTTYSFALRSSGESTIEAEFGETVRETFTGDGIEMEFATSAPIHYINRLSVDGIFVTNTVWTQDGFTVSLDRPPAVGAVIEIEYIAGAA